MVKGRPKLSPSRIRRPLREGEARRHAPVDERDPDRLRLVHVCDRRDLGDVGPCADYVMENMGLAVSYAQGLACRHVPERDLVNASVAGLMTAVLRFDKSKAGKFSTYAVWWMRHECNQLMFRDEVLVAEPGGLRDDRRELVAAEAALRTALGRDATQAELVAALSGRAEVEAALAAELGRTPEAPEVSRAMRGTDGARWSEARVADVRGSSPPKSRPLDPRRPSGGPDQDVVLDVRRAAAQLSPRERAVLCEEFDLGEPAPQLLPPDPVARKFLLEIALRRLRRLLGGG